ncbi:MAG: protein TolQ [Rickettsiaceae bacterium]|nr:protein TolQ [Rickettsiaceae bacterium]MDP4832124.1 protein TolQ [Rickettsiaceae bacterium]MDP5020320.1 protein TolQ [Rickettsiaceae bacterium]MDP5082640.1 protein TolQ [Rickettsiaceae bacterium]
MALEDTTEQVISTASNVDLSIISLIVSSDFIGKSVIAFLVIASIWSWAIIINKLLHYSALKKKMKSFEDLFWSGQVLDELYEKVKKSIDNPLAAVFVNAIKECKKGKNLENKKSDALRIGHKERVLGSMYLSRNREMEQLETKLGFLATVGSSAPFLGLFGTVWGIMHSFQSIASSKNTSLAVVAPGIAEALLATAIGLFAAIPATIFYNYLSSEIDKINNKTEDFIGELGSLISRAIDEEKM